MEWPRFSLRGLLLFVGGCSVLFTSVHFLMRAVAIEQRASRVYSFKAMLFALGSHDDVNGHLPAPFTTDADGQPACSWRFVTMTWWDPGSLAELPREDLPWNDPANALWVSLEMERLCFSPNSCMTNVVAVTGRGTAFDPDCQYKIAELPGDTILIVEVRDFGVHWMQPGDLEISEMLSSVGVGDRFGTTAGSFIVGFADGQAWALAKNIPFADLKKFLTIKGAMQYDRDEVLMPYRLPAR